MRSRSVLALTAVVVLGAACTTSTPPARGPYNEDADIRPDLVEIQPTSASAGDVVELSFPKETGRGLAFVLERGDDDGG